MFCTHFDCFSTDAKKRLLDDEEALQGIEKFLIFWIPALKILFINYTLKKDNGRWE